MYCYIVSAQLYLLQNNKYGKRRTSYKLLYNVVIKRNNLKNTFYEIDIKIYFLPTISKNHNTIILWKPKKIFFDILYTLRRLSVQHATVLLN
jgi:hypothetical protein